MREKKKFESSLDDAVAQGLNAAVNILMSHVDYLLTTGQGPTDFCPDDNADLDLRPTKTAREVVDNLKRHCDMLKGSTDKHILEVFNQEVGIRLHGFAISLSLSLPCLRKDPDPSFVVSTSATGSSSRTSSASSFRTWAGSN